LFLTQIQKKLDQEEVEQRSSEPAMEHTDSGCKTMSEEEDSADLWVEKYRPKSYLDLLSDEVMFIVTLYQLKMILL
jgi:hypothetical protein